MFFFHSQGPHRGPRQSASPESPSPAVGLRDDGEAERLRHLRIAEVAPHQTLPQDLDPRGALLLRGRGSQHRRHERSDRPRRPSLRRRRHDLPEGREGHEGPDAVVDHHHLRRVVGQGAQADADGAVAGAAALPVAAQTDNSMQL